MRAAGIVATDTGAWAATLINSTVSVDIDATDPVQALRQAALPVVPSGQHGQGFESGAFGIGSAQGISATLEP